MYRNFWITLLTIPIFLAGCSETTIEPASPKKDLPPSIQSSQPTPENTKSSKVDLAQIKKRYENQQPHHWGEKVPGVIQRLPTQEKVIALTFDACGGPTGSHYDQKLIQFLENENVPATLFVNQRWIRSNPETFRYLAKHPLFEIENHGTEHRPLSVNGHSIYGIQGTRNIGEVVEEVMNNHEEITKWTGREPKFFRAGTAYYDEIAVSILNDMGIQAAGFDIVGDAGATLSAKQVKNALLQAKPGSIVILHFNQPSKGTAEGVAQAVPILKQKGYRFVKLEDYF